MPSVARWARRRGEKSSVSSVAISGFYSCSIALLLVLVFGRGGAGLGFGGRFRHLAEQVVVEHGARDRRGGARAEAAVLDDRHERDSRILERREHDVERMVAVAL